MDRRFNEPRSFELKMRNLIITILAIPVFLMGLVSMVTPVPGGTVMIAFSLTALICTSPRARRCLQIFRTRFNVLNKSILWVENKIEDRITIVGDALRQTRPHADTNASCSLKNK
jgi:hypothetical protein